MFIEVITQGDAQALINVDQITSVMPLKRKEGSMITLTSTCEGGEAEMFEVKNLYPEVVKSIALLKGISRVGISGADIQAAPLTGMDIVDSSFPKE